MSGDLILLGKNKDRKLGNEADADEYLISLRNSIDLLKSTLNIKILKRIRYSFIWI